MACSSLIVSFLLVGFPFVGCSRKDSSNKNESSVKTVGNKKLISAKEKESRALKYEWKSIKKRLSGFASNRQKLNDSKRFMVKVKRYIDQNSISKSSLLINVEKAVKKYEKELDLEALDAFVKLEEKDNRVLSEKNAIIRKAEDLIERFRRDELNKFTGTNLSKSIDELEQRVEIFQKSETEYLHKTGRISTLGNDYITMLAVLEGYPGEYLNTPFGKKIKNLTEDTYAKFLEQESGKVDIDKTTSKSKKWSLNEFDVWGGPEGENVCDYSDKVLTLGPNPSDYKYIDEGSYIALGKESWGDIWISLEIKVEDPAGVYFGARGHEAFKNGKTVNVFSRLSLKNFELDKDKWYEFTVIIEGRRFDITASNALGKAGTGDLRLGNRGFFILQVTGAEAKISVRKMEYKILGKEIEETEDEEDDDDKELDLGDDVDDDLDFGDDDESDDESDDEGDSGGVEDEDDLDLGDDEDDLDLGDDEDMDEGDDEGDDEDLDEGDEGDDE